MDLSIPYPSEEARLVLWTSEYIKENTIFIAIPQKREANKLYFKLLKEDEIEKVGQIKKWILSLRAISLTSMFIPTLSTFLFLHSKDRDYDLYSAITAILIPCFLLLSVNVFNDVRDHIKLIDLPGTIGGSGVIQKGWLRPKQLTYFGLGLITISVVLAVPLFLKSPQLLKVIAPLTLISTIGYSGRPFNFKYRAMGDLIVFLCCGPILTVGYSMATFNYFDLSVILIGAFFGFLACAILHANNMNDIESDTQSGGKTLSSVLGFEKSKYLMIVYYVMSFAVLVGLYFTNGLSIVAIVPTFISIIPITKLLKKIFNAHGPDDPTIRDIRFITPQIHLLTGILLCLGILFLKDF